jgi:hypothetical protein
MLSVEFYNGYPTISSDTGSYVLTGKFLVAIAPYRAPGYSIFIRLTSLGISAWFTVAMQAVMVVYVLHETFDYLIDSDSKFSDYYFLASVCAMAALTSLPWMVSLLTPDVFAGVLFLSAFLLAFAGELRPLQRIALSVIFMISIAAHSSLFPIGALFVVVAVILRHVSRPPHGLSSTGPVLPWLLVLISLAGFCTAGLNRQMGLGFRLAPSRNAFFLARLFGEGLAADFLRENCPTRNFVSCRDLSHLPQTQDEFLFHHPLLLELKGHEDEMGEIIRGTLLAYPVRFVRSSAEGTLLQLMTLRTGDDIRSYGERNWNNAVISKVFPREMQVFLNGRQNRDRLILLANGSAAVDTPVFWLSVVACLAFAWTGRFGRINMFFYSAVTYLVINASICATFGGVYDRYQSRVAWILPFCLTAYICCLASDWKRWGWFG